MTVARYFRGRLLNSCLNGKFEMHRSCAAFALALLCGCSANHNSIFRHQALEAPSVTLVDAKQRGILSSATANGGKAAAKLCAEPSPDVFAVMAQGLSGGATLRRGAEPTSLETALSAAFSSSEQGSTIPRTQTINMLREVMYRTCERYLSGGITDDELPLQAIRDQRLIVSILAIEQLTGAVAPKPVVVGATATGASGASNADAALRLDDRYKDVQAKAAAESTKQKAYDELNGSTKDCEAIAKAVADNKADGLSDALKAKRPKCEGATSELATAKLQHKEAAAHYEKLAGIISGGSVPASASSAVMTPVAPGGLDAARSADVTAVASVVQQIVASTFDQDEFLFLCLKALKTAPSDSSTMKVKAPDLAAECIKYITSKVERQRRENEKATVEAAAVIDKASADLFERFWARVSSNDTLDAAKMAALKIAVGPSNWPSCLNDGKSKSEVQSCFMDQNKVVAAQRRALANGNK